MEEPGTNPPAYRSCYWEPTMFVQPKKKMSSTFFPKAMANFIANSNVGSYLSFSTAIIVCLLTPT